METIKEENDGKSFLTVQQVSRPVSSHLLKQSTQNPAYICTVYIKVMAQCLIQM